MNGQPDWKDLEIIHRNTMVNNMNGTGRGSGGTYPTIFSGARGHLQNSEEEYTQERK